MPDTNWFQHINELGEFAEFVARWIFNPNFEEETGAFAELACRRLHKLGYVSKKGGEWIFEEDETEKNREGKIGAIINGEKMFFDTEEDLLECLGISELPKMEDK